jgi:hypothetical protein
VLEQGACGSELEGFGSLPSHMGNPPAIRAMTHAIGACRHVLHLLTRARHARNKHSRLKSYWSETDPLAVTNGYLAVGIMNDQAGLQYSCTRLYKNAGAHMHVGK